MDMIRHQPWFQRDFPSKRPAQLLPVVIERLRGTPARLADRLAAVPQTTLTRRHADSWSIQENVGHLLDLEPPWMQRVADFAARRPKLAAADPENRKTHEANTTRLKWRRCCERFGRVVLNWSSS
jgi:hypothetical protein